MSNQAQSAADMAEPVGLNGVLWTELRTVRPALATDAAAVPPLETIYERVGEPEVHEPLSAICLSGGGIRSATFNLGVLQQLAHLGVLQSFDYLSSVSGGGYIASWLQAWMHHEPRALDQLRDFSRPNAFEPEPQPIRNLREYSNYLTPKLGLFSADTWTAAAMVVRNMLLNWLVLLPALGALVAIPWLFLAVVENNALFASLDGAFVALATATELLASIMVFRSRRYSSGLRYEQGTFVRRCVVPIVLAAALLCIAVLGLKKWITPGLAHQTLDQVHVWIFALVWCVVNPLLGWGMIELGWFKPQDMQGPQTDERVQRVQRRYEFWGLLASGALTAALLVGVILYWLAPLYSSPGWYVVLGLPILLGLYLLARTLFVAVASASESPYAAAACGNANDADREWWARLSGWVLLVAAAWIGVTAICLFGPMGLRWLADNVSNVAPAVVGALGGVSGIIAALVGSRDSTNASDAPANATLTRRIALAAAAPLFVVVVVVLVAWAVAELGFFTAVRAEWVVDAIGYTAYPSSLSDLTPWAFLLVPVALAGVAYVMGRIVNVNRFSLNGFYRNRLVRAYLGASRANRNADPFTGFSLDDNVRLAALQPTLRARGKLLPIVNTTLNLVRSGDKLAWQQRKSESFSMTPFFCGNHRQGYRPSESYGGNAGISLSTAMAISGAAANPSMGYNSSPAVGFLMALFNARLGAWLGNTNEHGQKTYRRNGPHQALWPLFAELFGMTHADGSYINLSDGGHFDNLGLYEVVLRRCRRVLVSDAGCDGKGSLQDLGNAIRKIRIDFGISIDFTREIEIRSNDEHKPGLYCAVATINYRGADGAGVTNGTLIYIKATKHAGGAPLPYDVYSYSKASQSFPHESTSDQWFSESQFESYRALGRHAVAQILGDQPLGEFRELFERAERYVVTPIVITSVASRELQG
ncbi:MAG TPA: patatin-like phospholipase family protein [Steroidobacteraceae bacterium]|nr:patatin-like phospholipase family protein [Steroidobacteraceae bacterium]